MSKEVNNYMDSRKNILNAILISQVADCVAVLIFTTAIVSIFYFMQFNLNSFLICIASFAIICVILNLSKKIIRDYLERVIILNSDDILGRLKIFRGKANSQKENSKIYQNKVENIQELIENLQKYSQDMKEIINKTQEKTNFSLDFTNNEYNAIKTSIDKMFSIRHKIQTIAELILELSDFVQSISSTIGLVEDIAEQTNLLALNAAVEAARAGEHGKGFAVVASEIRKLADESKQATSKIISLINDIQQTANSTVLATEEGTKEIESGLEHTRLISDNIEQLIKAINEISSSVQEIIVSSKQISNDSESTNECVEEITKVIKDNERLTNENYELFQNIETDSINVNVF